MPKAHTSHIGAPACAVILVASALYHKLQWRYGGESSIKRWPPIMPVSDAGLGFSHILYRDNFLWNLEWARALRGKKGSNGWRQRKGSVRRPCAESGLEESVGQTPRNCKYGFRLQLLNWPSPEASGTSEELVGWSNECLGAIKLLNLRRRGISFSGSSLCKVKMESCP